MVLELVLRRFVDAEPILRTSHFVAQMISNKLLCGEGKKLRNSFQDFFYFGTLGGSCQSISNLSQEIYDFFDNRKTNQNRFLESFVDDLVDAVDCAAEYAADSFVDLVKGEDILQCRDHFDSEYCDVQGNRVSFYR